MVADHATIMGTRVVGFRVWGLGRIVACEGPHNKVILGTPSLIALRAIIEGLGFRVERLRIQEGSPEQTTT